MSARKRIEWSRIPEMLPASTSEIAQNLKCAIDTVREHMSMLKRMGNVIIQYKMTIGDKGKEFPVAYWCLSEDAPESEDSIEVQRIVKSLNNWKIDHPVHNPCVFWK